MPGVICYRTPSQDCASLGHLYRSSPYADPATQPARHEQQSLRRPRDSNTNPTSSPRRFHKFRSNQSLESHSLSVSLLLSFSPEVVLLILAELPGKDILRCRSVCKLLKQFIDQSAKLQYIAQANARGLEPLSYRNSAHLCLAHLLSRERNWALFGSISSTHLVLKGPPRSEDDPDRRTYTIYSSGKILLCRGHHIVEHVLRVCGAQRTREYEVPGFESSPYDSVDVFRGWLGFGGGEAVHIYYVPDQEAIRVLSAPHRGAIGSVQFHGGFVAAMFRPERRCSGVLVWDRKSGNLIGKLLSVHAPALSFTFLGEASLALVRTDRSARSARIDTYTIGVHGAALRSSLALPDAHPTKWYAKADIHTGKDLVQASSEHLKDEAGIIAIDMELRIRAPHDPNTNTTDRRLSVILAIRKQAVVNSTLTTPSIDSLGKPSGSTPWALWSANSFRMITGVRISPNSPVWGHRIVAMGPELDKISLFDFCPVGVRAAAQVWKASGSWGTHTTSGGGVSVRAAIAQRARTLVRANELGVGVGWFDSMKPVVEQMPYVVSIRRGITDVQKVMLDQNSIVVLRNGEVQEHPASSKVIFFDFSAT